MKICVANFFEDVTSGTELVVFPSIKPCMPQWEAKTFMERFVDYAKQNKVYLVTPIFSSNQYLTVCLISPDGKISGLSYACNLSEQNRSEFIKALDQRVLETEIGKLLIMVDIDIYDPVLVSYAQEKDCDLIISTQYIEPTDFSKERIIFGAWKASQQVNKYVLNVSNKGCCVTVPCTHTKDKTLSGFESQLTFEAPFYMDINPENLRGE